MQLRARSSSTDKYVLVKNLRGMFKEVVVVTSDSRNDAPALHELDVGLSIDIAGMEVCKFFLL